MLQFEWDRRKAAGNFRKHGVTMDEAATVFADPLSGTIYDPDHSEDEDRFVTIGTSRMQRILSVCHTDRGDTIRIISARPATSGERSCYEKGIS